VDHALLRLVQLLLNSALDPPELGACVEMMKATKITQSYRKLYSEIEEILFRCDPMGISSKRNRGEYGPEVETIIPRPKEARSDADSFCWTTIRTTQAGAFRNVLHYFNWGRCLLPRAET
jgi:hypothetical protein